jgi:7,8-dihydropterin-6-yl-methyl-4-(beta-D-ribofuranosyl)aminobenzene 5'-phosphate synthase
MSRKTTLFYISLGLLLAGCAGSTQSESPLDLPATIVTEASLDPLTITMVYDNIPDDPRVTADLGFGAYIQYHDQAILFDTGRDGQILLENMQTLDIDPTSVQAVVLSHPHNDHIGGLADFLEVSSHPPVYLLSTFDDSFIERTQQATEVIEAVHGQEIAIDILTSGEISGDIPEQVLVIRTRKGLVVITGCAHPGIVRIVEQVIELTDEPVYMVMGGFHLGEASEDEIEAIIEDLKQLGVRAVAPSHCTGELATHMFAVEYGEDFISTGVGSVITIGD